MSAAQTSATDDATSTFPPLVSNDVSPASNHTPAPSTPVAPTTETLRKLPIKQLWTPSVLSTAAAPTISVDGPSSSHNEGGDAPPAHHPHHHDVVDLDFFSRRGGGGNGNGNGLASGPSCSNLALIQQSTSTLQVDDVLGPPVPPGGAEEVPAKGAGAASVAREGRSCLAPDGGVESVASIRAQLAARFEPRPLLHKRQAHSLQLLVNLAKTTIADAGTAQPSGANDAALPAFSAGTTDDLDSGNRGPDYFARMNAALLAATAAQVMASRPQPPAVGTASATAPLDANEHRGDVPPPQHPPTSALTARVNLAALADGRPHPAATYAAALRRNAVVPLYLKIGPNQRTVLGITTLDTRYHRGIAGAAGRGDGRVGIGGGGEDLAATQEIPLRLWLYKRFAVEEGFSSEPLPPFLRVNLRTKKLKLNLKRPRRETAMGGGGGGGAASAYGDHTGRDGGVGTGHDAETSGGGPLTGGGVGRAADGGTGRSSGAGHHHHHHHHRDDRVDDDDYSDEGEESTFRRSATLRLRRVFTVSTHAFRRAASAVVASVRLRGLGAAERDHHGDDYAADSGAGRGRRAGDDDSLFDLSGTRGVGGGIGDGEGGGAADGSDDDAFAPDPTGLGEVYFGPLTHPRAHRGRGAYYLDDPSLVDPRQRKAVAFGAYYRSTILCVSGSSRDAVEAIDKQFMIQHPFCRALNIRLSHIRRVKSQMLRVATIADTPVDLATIAYAIGYLERLILSRAVDLTVCHESIMGAIAGACLLLATKFVESGGIAKKMDWILKHCMRCFGLERRVFLAAEFPVFAALSFELFLRPRYVQQHWVRLLQGLNLNPAEYLSAAHLRGY